MTGAPDPGLDDLAARLRAGDRAALARAITLVESTRPEDHARGRALVEALLPDAGGAIRVGFSGAPGVGKSTLIDALGARLLEQGRGVAVLAVDPTSTVTGGSILGDKTRMERLCAEERAFVRPSPAGGAAGGVARATREAILLCEAAGFEVVIVETVGVGQSETAVADLVDSFVLLLMPGAGDELQGIKRGVMELADVVAITKADGPLRQAAAHARGVFADALELLHGAGDGWCPPVVTTSARTGEGLDTLWQAILEHRAFLGEAGLAQKRADQALRWFEEAVRDGIARNVLGRPEVATALADLRARVRRGEISPGTAAERVLDLVGAASS